MADSARWCATCQAWGDHHTDRHPIVADNPYRFTVKVQHDDDRWWVDIGCFATGAVLRAFPVRWFPTEAEANEHADMILAALQGATRE
jgi:hypothetical protein